MIDKLQDVHFRRWLYGVATAVLVLLGGYGIISSSEQENILGIITAILNIGAAGATTLAYRKTKPGPVVLTVTEEDEDPEQSPKHAAE
mgnify:CR=1 FL=1